MEKNDIIQITDKTHPWYPCILVVQAIGKYFVRAYISIPIDGAECKGVRQEVLKLKQDQVGVVGKLLI